MTSVYLGSTLEPLFKFGLLLDDILLYELRHLTFLATWKHSSNWFASGISSGRRASVWTTPSYLLSTLEPLFEVGLLLKSEVDNALLYGRRQLQREGESLFLDCLHDTARQLQ